MLVVEGSYIALHCREYRVGPIGIVYLLALSGFWVVVAGSKEDAARGHKRYAGLVSGDVDKNCSSLGCSYGMGGSIIKKIMMNKN